MRARWSRILAGAALVACAMPAPGPAGWTGPRRLGDSPSSQNYVQLQSVRVIASGDVVHAAWFAGEPDSQRIHYARSESCGDGWTAQLLVAEAPSRYELDLNLVATAGGLHLVWDEIGEEGDSQTFLSSSLDGGGSWSVKRKLSPPEGVFRASYPAVLAAANDSTLFVGWKAWWKNRHRFVVASSRDDGATWSFALPGARVSRHAMPAFGLEGRSERLHLVWAKYPEEKKDMLFRTAYPWRKSADRLGVETPPLGNIGGYAEFEMVWPFGIVGSGEGVGFAWGHAVGAKYGYLEQELFYQRFEDGSWVPASKMTSHRSRPAWRPSFSAAGDLLLAAWSRFGGEVFVARSDDEGRSWRRKRFREASGGRSSVAAVAASTAAAGRCRDTIHLVYGGDSPNDPGLLYRRHPRRLP